MTRPFGWRRLLGAIRRPVLRRAGRIAVGIDRWRTRGRPIDVIFIGDSITQAWPDHDPRLFLGNAWVNAGVSGETTAEMRARFDRDVVRHGPRAVHIMGGTNDLWHGDPGPTAMRTIAHLEAMVEMATSAGIAVVLASPPPVSREAAVSFGHPELYGALCTAIAAIAGRQALVHVDYATALLDADGAPRPACFTDGVHLTRRGYRAIRAQAEAAIRGVSARPEHPGAGGVERT